jgi:hypothetical protein
LQMRATWLKGTEVIGSIAAKTQSKQSPPLYLSPLPLHFLSLRAGQARGSMQCLTESPLPSEVGLNVPRLKGWVTYPMAFKV